MRRMEATGICAALAVLDPGAALADIAIATPQDLATALSQAPAGEVLVLAPGDYGALTVTQATRGSKALTLRSADPGRPARITAMTIDGAANLTLDGITFDYRFQPGDPLWATPFTIARAHDLVIRNSIFDGDVARGMTAVDNGFGAGIGLMVDRSDAITLSGNRFFDFLRGLAVSDSDHVTVIGNEITAIRSDGMDFSAVQSLLLAENTLHDFKASRQSDDHADMIQFWTAGTTRPSTDVVIRDNVLNSGHGSWTQSLLIGNELVRQGVAGREMYYRNVTISGNVIVNSHLHGISVGETVGLTISGNTLIHNRRTDGEDPNPALWTPRINISEKAEKVTVEGNATPMIDGAQSRPDWTLRDNVLIQDADPAAPDYYDVVFVAALTGDPATLAPFTYLPGGPVDGVKVGAARLKAAAGAVSSPRTEKPAQAARPVPALLHFDAEDGQLMAGGKALPGIATAPAPEGQGRVLGLGQGQPPVVIRQDAVAALTDAAGFLLSLDLRLAATSDPAGHILRLGNGMSLSWKPSSGLSFRLETAKVRPVTLATGPLAMEAGGWHRVEVRYDAASGRISLRVDGAIRAQGRSGGPLGPEAGQDLILGAPSGTKALDGYLRAFDMSVDHAAFALP